MDETCMRAATQGIIQVTMPSELIQELTTLAAQYGIDRSALIVSRLTRDGGNWSLGLRLAAIEQTLGRVVKLLEVLVGRQGGEA